MNQISIQELYEEKIECEVKVSTPIESTHKSKLIGRRASLCRKCSGNSYFINRMGGVQCETCCPAKSDSEIVLRLRIDDGRWQDAAAEKFDLTDVPFGRVEFGRHIESSGIVSATSNVNPTSGAGKRPPLTHPAFRGADGELSENEIELFSSEMIWAQPEQWIVLRPKTRLVNRLGGKSEYR